MTKMAAMLVYGKIHLESSSLEQEERLQENVVCSIRDSSPS